MDGSDSDNQGQAEANGIDSLFSRTIGKIMGPSKLQQLAKEERKRERKIMRKLRNNKGWNKIANQIKFKNFIRLILQRKNRDPDFMTKKFKIFAIIDKL